MNSNEAELVKLIYQYYPKEDQYEYWKCDAYLKTAEFQRLAAICDKAEIEQDKWIRLQENLKSLSWLDEEPFEWTHLFHYNPCYRCEIALPDDIYSNSKESLFIHISVIAPLYALYVHQSHRYHAQRTNLPGLPDALKNMTVTNSIIYFPAENPVIYKSSEDEKRKEYYTILSPVDPLPPTRNLKQDLLYAKDVQTCIETVFNGYQSMPLELVNKCIPDILIDNYNIGEASFFHALFTTHVW